MPLKGSHPRDYTGERPQNAEIQKLEFKILDFKKSDFR